MIGIQDPSVLLAYILVPGLAALCAVYGFRNWNKEGEISEEEIREESTWMKEELKIENEISGEDTP